MLARSNKLFPARTRRQILVERDEETNEPLFARRRTDQLATYATWHVGQIEMPDLAGGRRELWVWDLARI